MHRRTRKYPEENYLEYLRKSKIPKFPVKSGEKPKEYSVVTRVRALL